MGLPVVTLPQSRVVSRQTSAIMSAIGYLGTIAESEDDYINRAVNLAANLDELNSVRSGMRLKMQASGLMDLENFTKNLEHTLINYYKFIESSVSNPI